MIPFGEFAPDIADYNLEVATVADNVLPVANGYRPILSPLSTGYDSQTDHGGSYSGFVWNTTLASGSAISFYITAFVDSSDANVYYASKQTGSPWAFDNGGQGLPYQYANRHGFVDWGQSLIIVFPSYEPQVITSDDLNDLGVTKTADLGGTPPEANHAAKVGQFLVFAGTRESGTRYYSRIAWSGFDDPTSWTYGDNQCGFVDRDNLGDATGIVSGVRGDYGISFHINGVGRMDYVGIPAVWKFTTLDDTHGCEAPGTIVQVGADIYYLSRTGFRVIKGGSESISIGENKIDQWFYGNSGSVGGVFIQNQYMSGAYDPESNSVWWSFHAPAASSTALSDRVIIYNISTGKWSTATTDSLALFTFTQRHPTSGRKSFGIGLIKELSSNPTIYTMDSTALAGVVETGHLFDENLKTEITGVRPIIDGTATVSVLTKADLPSDSETTAGPTATDASGKADFRSEGKYHRFRCTTSGAFTRAVGVVVDQSQTGDR